LFDLLKVLGFKKHILLFIKHGRSHKKGEQNVGVNTTSLVLEEKQAHTQKNMLEK